MSTSRTECTNSSRCEHRVSKLFHFSIFTLLILNLSATADLFNTNGFSRRAQIRVTGYTNSATLTNFPYLVVFTNGAPNFTYSDVRTDGGDLRFCDNTFTNTLFHEIEKWTNGSSSYVWVRVPRINVLTNSFWAFWGNATCTIPVSSTNGSVWMTNYLGVWHMDLWTNPGIGGNKTNFLHDASLNNNHGIATNATLIPGTGLKIPTNVVGIAGNAIGFDPAQTNYVNCGTNALAIDGRNFFFDTYSHPDFTLSGWIYRRQTNASYSTGRDSWFSYGGTNTYSRIEVGTSDGRKINIQHSDNNVSALSTTYSSSVWTHVAILYDTVNGLEKLFVNGELVEFWSPSIVSLNSQAQHLYLGAGGYSGEFPPSYVCGTQFLDEVRFSIRPLSPAWIWSEYQNIKSNSSFGYLDVYGAPIIDNANGASNVTQTAATLVGNVLSTGGYATAVTVYYGTTDGGTNAGSWANSYTFPSFPTVGLVTQQVTLNPNTTYYYRHYATNFNGTRWAPSSASFTTLASTNASTHSVRIRLATTVAGIQTNFPASIVLNTSLTGFAYEDFASSSGNDLRFSTTNLSQELSYEIESWNTGGNSYVWVLIPNMTSNTTILAHWGNTAFAASAPAYTTNGAVWPSYRAVWHMNSSNLLDSTAYKRSASNVGGTISTGNIGGAMAFDTGKYATWAGSSWTSGAITIEAIVNLETIVSLQRILTMNNYAVSIRNLKEPEGPNGSIEFVMGNRSVISEKALARRHWHYVAGTVEANGIMRVFVDGTQVGISSGAVPPTITGGYISDISQDVTRGGMIDELRISDTALPLGRIRTTFANALSNSTFAAVENISSEIMFEPFEYNTNATISISTGNLNGQHGWIVTPFNGAIVQSTDIQSGTNAVTIGTNEVILYRGFSDSTATNIWIDFYAKGPRRTDPGQPGLSSAASAGFYINTNWNIVAKSGSSWVVLTGAVAIANGGTATNFVAESNNWTRYQAYLNYSLGKWWLLASSNVPGAQASVLATNLSFNAQRASLSRFQVTATNALLAGQLDTVYIWKTDATDLTNAAIPNLDLNTNGIPDAWERSYVIGGTNVASTNDADLDGYDEMAEFIMGTDPHDANSFTKITGLELVSSTGNNVRVIISGGDRNTTDGRNTSGDTRTYRVVSAATYTNLTKSVLGTQTETLSGENEYIDTGAAINASSRFYQVQVSMNGRTYTNTEQWAMFTQQRPVGKNTFMTIPVSLGTDPEDKNLAGRLGQQLGFGLHGGSTPATSDRAEIRTADGQNWLHVYWMTTNGGLDYFWSVDGTGTRVSDMYLQPGTPIWLCRSNSMAATRTNTVFLGQLYSNAPSIGFTKGAFTMFGWPLPDTTRQRNQGASTPTNAMGFVDAVGGTQPLMTNGLSGSQLYIWTGSSWKYYWLYDNHSTNASNLNRRWWDPISNTYANISLEPGQAFYFYNSSNWSTSSVRPATNFTYAPFVTN